MDADAPSLIKNRSASVYRAQRPENAERFRSDISALDPQERIGSGNTIVKLVHGLICQDRSSPHSSRRQEEALSKWCLPRPRR